MSKVPEVMIDLETLSTRAHATIAVISAVKFDRYKGETKDPVFYRKVNTFSCQEVGMHVSEETVNWWKGQDEKLQKDTFEGEDRVQLYQALNEFTIWFGNSKKVWSNGACFDIPILSEAYERSGMKVPWKFWDIRDTRTLYELAGITSKDLPKDNLHNALADCRRQIWGVTESMKRIGGVK